jgi:hypothetical protein
MNVSMHRKRRWVLNSVITALALGVSAAALAYLEITEDQQAALIDLYNATDGDNWERSDNWLDEEINACNWYGVHCFEHPDGVQVHLALANNELTGVLPESLGEMPGLNTLLLPGNELTGSLVIHSGQYPDLTNLNVSDNLLESLDISPDAAPNLGILVASNNLLAGTFPDFLEGRDQFGVVNLSHNLLGGDLPEWLADLNLNRLYLGDNDFTGSIFPAVEALADDLEHNPSGDPDQLLRLDLRANQFSGELDDWLADHARDFPNWLSLCWNDLTVVSSDAEAMLAAEHMDGEFEYCLGQSFQAPQLTHSGSWYHPERSGEGISMMMLDNGHTLIHWFTYAPPEHPPERQAWFSGNREVVLPAFDMIDLYAPIGGEFAEGLPDPDSYVIDLGGRMDVLMTDADTLHTRQYVNMNNANGDFIGQIFEYTQLTQLAGTTCDNQTEFQQYSGAWYHPERDGEGFVIEVLPDDRTLVYWFTYAADDSEAQFWMMGDGEFIIDDVVIGTPPPGTPVARVNIEAVHQPVGTVFGPDFNADDVELEHWGRFELRFFSDDEASIYWESDRDDFGAGDYALERLAQPMLAACE